MWCVVEWVDTTNVVVHGPYTIIEEAMKVSDSLREFEAGRQPYPPEVQKMRN